MGAPDDEHERDVDGLAPHERLREALDARAEALEHAQSALAAAERANDLKDRFLATVSHELRTPLNAILGWVQLIRAGDVTPEQVTRGLSAIERNARAQARLIADLLDVSHMLHGRLALDREPVELGAIAEQAVESMRPVAEAKGVRLLWRRLGAKLLTVCGDPRRLRQVVINLISNAVKFTPAGGEVRVAVQEEDASACVSVVDTGEGMSAETQEGLFDRFVQGETSGKRAGLGLGLVIVKELVELHGGWIRASSKGAGLGATVKVSLPLLTPGPMTVR